MNTKKLAVVLGVLVALSATGTALQTFKADVVFYNDSTAAIQDITIQEREQITAFVDDGNFEIVLQNQTQPVFNGFQNIVFQSFVDKINGSQLIHRSNLSRTLYIPYTSKATDLQIQSGTQTVATADLPNRLCTNADNTCSAYCQGRNMDPDCTCGNGVCDSDIEQEVCPADCRNQSTTVQEPPDTETDDGGFGFLQVLLYLVVVGIAGVIVYVLVKGSSSTDSQQRRDNRPRPRQR